MVPSFYKFKYTCLKGIDGQGSSIPQVNPHVASILQNQSNKYKQFVARNACGSTDNGLLNSAMAGISAFAFQGTNAHAIMGTSSGSLAIKNTCASIWKRKRAWYVYDPV